MRFYRVVVHDHTQLGGPMGTERTWVIASWNALTETIARRLFRKALEGYNVPDGRWPEKIHTAKLYDFGHIGIEIRPQDMVEE